METRIKALLAAKKMNVNSFHKQIGGNRTLCYQIARGHSRATRPQRKKFAEALEVRVEELFDEDGMPLLSAGK